MADEDYQENMRLTNHKHVAVDSVHILVLRIIGSLCLLFGLIELGVGGALYNYLSNVKSGAWWAGIFTITTGLSALISLNRKWVIGTCFFSSIATLVALVGAVIDGLASTKFISLTACSYTSNGISINFGEKSDYASADKCELNGPFVADACYCVTAGGKSCGTYSLSPFAVKAKQNCANILGNYANTLSASTAVCVITFIILFFLSIFTCIILLCPHKSPIIVAQKKNEAERIDIGFDTTLV
jgi:hypothetical protein